MICPNCHRVISDNEICPCKLEAVKKKNDELKRERAELEEKYRIEEEKRAAEAKKRKEEASQRADFVKNNIADISSSSMSDFLDFIQNPDKEASKLSQTKNMLNVGVLVCAKLILLTILYFSLSRSIFTDIIRPNDAGFVGAAIVGILLSLATTAIDTGIFFFYYRKIDIKEILAFSSAKNLIEIPFLLLASVFMSIVPALGVATLITGIALGATTDFLISSNRDTKWLITLSVAYIARIFVMSIVVLNI